MASTSTLGADCLDLVIERKRSTVFLDRQTLLVYLFRGLSIRKGGP